MSVLVQCQIYFSRRPTFPHWKIFLLIFLIFFTLTFGLSKFEIQTILKFFLFFYILKVLKTIRRGSLGKVIFLKFLQ